MLIKVNLMVRGQILNGYMNLDCAGRPEDNDGRIMCNPTDLNIIDANEVEEFIVNDVLDYLPIQARQQTLSHWLSKLSHGGIMVLYGLDYNKFAHALYTGKIDINQANTLVYGIGKKSFCYPLINVQMALQTGQIEVEYVSYNDLNYIIKLRRK